MFRKLALVGVCAAVIGCRDNTVAGPVDLSHPGQDLSFNPNDDLSMMQMMTSSSAHDIDTDAVAAGTAVTLKGMISVDNVHRHLSKTTMYCEYRTIVMDQNCTTAPCGVELYQRGIKLTDPNASTTDCPFADAAGSMTDMGSIKEYGDVMDVTGSVKSFIDNTAPMTVKLHSLTVDTLTVTATKQPLPAPIAVTDQATSLFVIHSGTGWNMYEGTYIKLSPASGKFTTQTPDQFGNFTVLPGGAQFSTADYFGPKDAGVFPMPNSMYSSISGVANNDFGGAIQPLFPTDYAP
jgi:hypothetical protein